MNWPNTKLLSGNARIVERHVAPGRINRVSNIQLASGK